MTPRRIYLDGNSLGPPAAGMADALVAAVEHWDRSLIGGWNEGWWDLPVTVGERIAPLLGAAPGQVVVGDSTTVMWFKAVGAALRLRPDRTTIVTHRGGFPTDRHVIDALGARVVAAGPGRLAEALGPDTAVLAVTHVDHRYGRRLDMAALTAAAHAVGALVVWDLSHSVGAMDLHLDEAQVDLAVGCTYKYLNGGPGSPAYCYVAERHLDSLTQPIQGWMGAQDPFLMGPDYAPTSGIRRFLSGTPAVVGMLAVADMVELVAEVGMAAVREKSVGLTEHAIALADEHLTGLGVTVASPRDAHRRGGHVTLHHPAMREVVETLWERDVIPDYRDPGGLRVGLSPLSTSYDEVDRGIVAVRELLA